MQVFGNIGDIVTRTVKEIQEKNKGYVISLIYDQDPMNVSFYKSMGYELLPKGDSVDGITRRGDCVVMRVPEEIYNAKELAAVESDYRVRMSYKRNAAAFGGERDVEKYYEQELE